MTIENSDLGEFENWAHTHTLGPRRCPQIDENIASFQSIYCFGHSALERHVRGSLDACPILLRSEACFKISA